MKKYLFILSLLLSGISFGQVAVKKSVIDSGGGSATVGTTKVISTIGELAVQENTQGSIHISEGFIGPYVLQSLGVENYTALQGITIFPNPAIDYMQFSFANAGNYQIQIYDLNGKLIAGYHTDENTYKVPVSHLRRATYLVLVKNNETKQYATYKIVKR